MKSLIVGCTFTENDLPPKIIIPHRKRIISYFVENTSIGTMLKESLIKKVYHRITKSMFRLSSSNEIKMS